MSEIIHLTVTVDPANTEGAPALSEYIQTPRGRIGKVVPQFPTGCNNTISAVVETYETQVAPTKGVFRFGGGSLVSFDGLRIPITGNDPAVRLRAWAEPGNAFPHTIDVYLTIEPFAEVP